MLYVTGITGHTGKWFVEKLIREQYRGPIRCLLRKNSNTQWLDTSGLCVEKIYGDLSDTTLLEMSMQGIDTVIHIAGITASEQVIQAAIKNHVKWVILVHTTGRYSKYKSASEEYIRIEESLLKKREQIGITVLRPTMIYGSSMDRNMYKLVDFLYSHKLFPLFGEGKNLMQPVHARDLGYAYYDVLTHREITYNKEYNLPGKQAITYRALVECVSKTLGKKNVIVELPLWLSLAVAKIYNAFCPKAAISVEQVLRMQEDKAFSYEKAAQDFGYAPQAFEDGIVGEVEEYIHALQKRS